MADRIAMIAANMGATVKTQCPEVGGGAFGVPHLNRIVAALRERLPPIQVEHLRHETDSNSTHFGPTA